MEARHEIVTFPRNMKLRVYMHAIGTVPRHWHGSLELLFLINGEARLNIDGRELSMSAGDVTLINSNAIHELDSENGAVFVTVQIKPDMFDQFTQDSQPLEFDCVSSGNPDQTRYDGLRMCLSRMLLENIHRDVSTDYRNYGLGYWLLGQLVERFRIPGSDQPLVRQRYTQRLAQITDFIEAHYAEDITLAELAERLGLSVPYLSGFFAKYMGVKFTRYCNDVKLSHALQELLRTDHTVEQVAADNGFAESHTFIRVFKQKYGETPNVYRQRMRERSPAGAFPEGLDYMSIEPTNYLSSLQAYASNGTLFKEEKFFPPAAEALTVPAVDVTAPGRALRHTFKRMITVGRAHDLLNHDIRQMLRDIQKTVGYEYIKFHGLLSDDMMICSRTEDGSLQFHFHQVDSAIDFLRSIGMKPLMQLSFMPTILASDPDKTIFYNPFNTSPPKDMGEWNMLIDRLTRHLISRYGRAEVERWPFTVWNEPDTPPDLFGFERIDDFLDLYVNTWRTVKSVCPSLRFGTPGVFNMHHLGRPEWVCRFFQMVRDSGCEPDFICLHYYSDILPYQGASDRLLRRTASCLPRDPDDFARFIDSSRELFASLGFGDKPVYLTEWNFTLSHRNLVSDTSFKTCYILRNLLQNYDALESFAYWTLTDLIEENPLPVGADLFHGGQGIYTMTGVRKGVFYAFDFANRLGNELLAQGEGYFVTRGWGGIQIITYNYVHYGDLFASGDALGVTSLERYAPFDMTRRLTVSVPLTGLEPGKYIQRERFVNRDHGSAFDAWVRCGGLPFTPEDTELYAGACVPALRMARVAVPDGAYTYTATLDPLEIRFTELTPADLQ